MRKEQRRRINEAIERKLTPEQKLAIHRGHVPSLPQAMIFIMLTLTIIVLAVIPIFTSYGLSEAFGENEWENFIIKGIERARNETSVGIFPWLGIIVLVVFLGVWGVKTIIWGKRDIELKREILARLKAEGNK